MLALSSVRAAARLSVAGSLGRLRDFPVLSFHLGTLVRVYPTSL